MQEETTLVTTFTIIKNALYLPVILLGLPSESYTILGVFIGIDMILGIARTGIIYGGKHIRSYRFSVGLISKLLMITVPLLVVWTGRGVGINLFVIADWSLRALILSQAYSIFGNIYAIHIRKDVPEFDAVSWILRKIQVSMLSLLQNGIETDKGNLVPAYKEEISKDYEKKD